MNYDRIAELIVTLEGPFKVLLLFMAAVYVLWFWKVGFYDGFMTTLQTIRTVLEKSAIMLYLGTMWLFVSIVRAFRVIFATVRDFFISRI